MHASFTKITNARVAEVSKELEREMERRRRQFEYWKLCWS